jgi:lysophospholipid acyltransferase (LPLAT)-like uncharacterized protein
VTPHIEPGAPVIVAFWHERLPLMPVLFLRARQARADLPAVAVLVSRHADGRLIGRLMRHFGTAVIHGSTARGGRDRGGAAGLRQAIAHVAAGGHVALTPDGPRGPRRVAAAGVAQLAAVTGAPVLPVAAQTRPRWTLRTWDRMVLPLPWGRGVMVIRPGIRIARGGVDAGLQAITAALNAATEQADQLCPTG